VAVVEIAEWVISGAVLATVAVTFARFALNAEKRAQLRLGARRRQKRAERAAVEASLDDPAFSPDAIRAAVKTIATLGVAVSDGHEPPTLRGRRDIGLIRAWGTGVRAEAGEFLALDEDPMVHVLRVVNREDEAEDRVVARVCINIARDPHRSHNLPGDRTLLAARHVRLEQRWTLARHGDDWFLVSLSGDPLSSTVMSSPLIASPASDDARLREAGLQELGAAGAVAGVDAGELLDRDASPSEKLNDLALVDDRFDPALLEATIKHIVEAWEAVSDGSAHPLSEVATKHGIRSLAFPGGPGGRRYIRDATLSHWKIAAITPPTVRVAVEIKAAVYRSDGRSVTGSDRRRRKLNFAWTLKLGSEPGEASRWRLDDSDDQ
jgi:hypothetical protein